MDTEENHQLQNTRNIEAAHSQIATVPTDANITGAQSSPAFGFPTANLEGPLHSVSQYSVPFSSFPEAFLSQNLQNSLAAPFSFSLLSSPVFPL